MVLKNFKMWQVRNLSSSLVHRKIVTSTSKLKTLSKLPNRKESGSDFISKLNYSNYPVQSQITFNKHKVPVKETATVPHHPAPGYGFLSENSNIFQTEDCKINFGGSSTMGIQGIMTENVASKRRLSVKAGVNTNLTMKNPAQRLVEAFPPSAQPYLRLSRIHQPIGTWLLFWPCTWGLGLASGGIPDLTLLTLFGTGAFIMRGAGCTINDMWDRHIDKRVIRTSDRPLASGELRLRHATVWLAFQLSFALTILAMLNEPCFIIGVTSLGLVTLYPLAKRVSNWPQAVLGSTFNIGVLMGFTATAKYQQLGYIAFPWIDPGCISLYLAGVAWTLIYDTIYAHQDRADDTALGLGSTARRFGNNTKLWLSGFSGLMISSLTMGGILSDLSFPYFLSVGAVASHIAWQISTLDINNPQNCSERFKSNRHIGWILFLGILTSSIVTTSRSTEPKSTISISKPCITNNGPIFSSPDTNQRFSSS